MSRTTPATRRALLGAVTAVMLTLAPGLTATAAPAKAPAPPFAGTPVTGVDLSDNEQVPDDAPELEPGVYADELTASEDAWRAYRVTRTAPGSSLHVSLTTKPSTYTDYAGDPAYEDLRIRILAPDGTECHSNEASVGDSSGTSPFVTVAAASAGQLPEEDEGEPSCRATGTFTVLVGRDGPDKTTAAELQVLEEPPVADLADLPEAGENHPSEVELPAAEATPVRGGRGFTDATEVTAGTWSDTLTPGETRVYRVKVEYGQTARFTANGPTGGFRFPAEHEFDTLWVRGQAYAPDRQLVDDSTSVGSFSSGSSSPQSVNTAALQFRNRFSDVGPWTSGMSGWYYYAVSVGDADLGEALTDQPLTIAFTVDVEGKASDTVRYDHTAGDWGSTSDAEDEGLRAWAPWAAGGALGLAVLGGIAWLVLRRRSRSRT